MDFDERMIPDISSNYLFQEALSRYVFASKLIKKNFKVLDVGCGTGYGTELLAEKVIVVGVDSNNETLTYARNHYLRPTFKKGNAEKLPFKDGEFDMVVSYEVIEHLKKPESFLKEIKRVLVKNGIFTLSTPNVNFPHVTTSPYHKREYKKFELVKLLREHFRKVEIYGQKKNKKAQEAFVEFLRSQDVRQKIVDSDRLGIRKLMPRGLKELIWRYFGSFYGRSAQDKLSTLDFPITKVITKDTEYFIAVCKK
ncbi:hypothetical protein A2630_00020 [Candidatus Woesebacteria bacterium RIFCSPHIGHO2_01_FULL_44_10]|uniref:Methyltransferase type 11 domain-containing protein n=1 Tax=Candidatus Woesebacteria bacterium RIFCSPLOWO2_01_FULL_44_14 TaxID=1802525 RepID=A0A1F8BXA9_9BACT|nr:MAG: hypothetical protein A2630_00020 [Candidatus Woesebacteria bacterium RIFCSPHIGHO2_01_FULL_44_10]OGM56260.1 MAG: hypothetical protein A3F62_03340 [Candidatus Woesebacteria bacterium RIFCSPHIGHO2_12_FULL_44_11]OGM68696.1 MAG: hypothetical protein A2975_05320 [Candidatus Woesebacteria bacterium RIFCSPLOWO2_01_FULL_44_14]